MRQSCCSIRHRRADCGAPDRFRAAARYAHWRPRTGSVRQAPDVGRRRCPACCLTQIAATRALARQGMDLYTPPVAMAGHSQGVLAVEALKAGGHATSSCLPWPSWDRCRRNAGTRRRGNFRPWAIACRWYRSPTRPRERIGRLLDEFAQDVRTVLPPVLSIRNGRRAVVNTGNLEQLSRFELHCRQISKEEADRKEQGPRRRRLLAVFEPAVVVSHPGGYPTGSTSSRAGPRRRASMSPWLELAGCHL